MPSNPLTDALPARYRKVAYAAVFVAGLAFAAWEASDGNWTAFVGGLIGSLAAALAHGNTKPAPVKKAAARKAAKK